ncbi:MAG: hypothetical protein RBR37_06835 [Advenella sp.]|nr:hypothetical protein [Advenella sp.]
MDNGEGYRWLFGLNRNPAHWAFMHCMSGVPDFFVWNMLSLFSVMLKTQKFRLDGVITAM